MMTDKNQVIGKGNIIPAAACGLLLTCSFPKIGAGWLAWFALVPLFWAVKNLTWKDRFFVGFLSGMVHYLTLFYYMIPFLNTFGPLPIYLCVPILILLAAYLAVYTALFAVSMNRLSGSHLLDLLLIPCAWVALEYIRSFFLTGFPWELLGYSQYRYLPVIQISDMIGVYGVSFLIVHVNAILFLACRFVWGKFRGPAEVRHKIVYTALAMGVVFFSLNMVYGVFRINHIERLAAESRGAVISVLQGNIEQKLKWNPDFQVATIKKYIRLSRLAAAQKPDLIVWPETAAPFYLFRSPRLTQMVQQGVRDSGTHFLIGSPRVVKNNGHYDYFNTAYFIGPDGSPLDRYDKFHLVPFGEYVPLGRWLPFIGKVVANVGDFKPGKPGHVLSQGKLHLGTLICYEIIFPELSRAMARNGANLLLNITNDAWYGKTSAPFQHFSMAVFRAVENRRALARSANTGISGFIDPTGRIVVSTPLFEDAVETRTVPLVPDITVYTQYGDLFAVFCLVVFISVVAWSELCRRRKGGHTIEP